MPSLRSVKDASGRATMRRQMKRIDIPEVPNVPGLQEELNRRRSRHLSSGGGTSTEPLGQSGIEMREFNGSEYGGDVRRAGSIAGSSSRASSSCADHSDLYSTSSFNHHNSSSSQLPHQYSTSSFASSTHSTASSMSQNAPQPPQRLPSSSLSTFQQQQLNNTAALLLQQQNHRNSTGSSSSQASSGFESSKTLNNLANSNSSGSFSSTLFTTSDNSPPPSIGISATDTLRKSTAPNSNRHSSAGSDCSSSRPRSQCTNHLLASNPQINIAEMISRGIPDSEILGEWLDKMGMQKYLSLFITQGYDVPSVAKLTSEDLLALGINDPNDRKRLHLNIQEWNVNDNWPVNVDRGESAALWLVTIGLQQYVRLFESEGYIQMKDLETLNFEELEDMGIKKLGHIKRICLALRKLKQHRQQQNQQPIAQQSSYQAPAPLLAACSSSSLHHHQQNNQNQQQFHSPDSGFTENSSLFSTIQRPRLSSQDPQRHQIPSLNLSTLTPQNDTPILDDLLDKPASKLQIYSTRQLFAADNTQPDPFTYNMPSLQLRHSTRNLSPPPPAPQPLLSGRMHPQTARPSFNDRRDYVVETDDYASRRDWMPERDRKSVFRSQPQTPIRQQNSLSSFSGQIPNINETSFMLNNLSNELNAIQLANK